MEPDPRASGPARTSQSTPALGPAPGRRHILVVEDHRDTADVLRRLLVRDGHDVAVADCCAVVRELCSDGHKFDVILCDLTLPDGDGTELVPLFRAHSPEARLIALTAHGMPDAIERTLAAGFHAHVLKPVSRETLQPHLA